MTRRTPLLLLTLLTIGAAAEEPTVRFEETARRAGLSFTHEHGGSGSKYLVETMGSGACFFDYDGDGDDDLYLVQGAPLPGFEAAAPLRNALYRNDGPVRGDGVRFVDVTSQAAVGDAGWGMGCAAGDVDGDGRPDLLVTNFGPDVLFRNAGDGTFTDETVRAGVGDPRWSASAAFGDADGDGDLDLYVSHYVDFTVATHQRCGALAPRLISYCHPDAYSPVADSFYRNLGDGRFREDTGALGDVEPGNGLGVVWADLDDDGRPDIYVANDNSPNFLFLGKPDGAFVEAALLRGAAVNDDGRSEAGMGLAVADVDGDGRDDIFVTHLEMETNTLYRNLGGARFLDWSFPSGLGPASLRYVGFGTAAIDFDLDGDLDLIVANGHPLDDVAETLWTNVTYEQPMHLLENDGSGRFREVGARHGTVFAERIVGRGLATADLEGDGDLDIVVAVNGGPVRLLEADGAAGNWLELDLLQGGANRFAIGARVGIETAGRNQRRTVRTASSYLSQNSLTLHVGLGGAGGASVAVAWPGGGRGEYRGLAAGRRYRLSRQGGR